MKQPTKVFKALADETRLRVLHLFLQTRYPLCVCEMVAALKLPQYHVSKNLLILKNAGLVDAAKSGTWAYYSLNYSDPSNELLFGFLKNYLSGDVLEQDKNNLRLRLLLREAGRCVVGMVSDSQLTRLIKSRRGGIP